MKKLRLSFISLFVIALLMLLVSCNDGSSLEGTDILITGLTIDADVASGTVSNDTAEFSFIDNVEVADGASYVVTLDAYKEVLVPSKTVTLTPGDNVFYVWVSNKDEFNCFTVNIRRKYAYTVTFNTPYSNQPESQTVEEGALAKEPSITPYIGVTFYGWNFDFSTPINKNLTVKANFAVNEEMKGFEFTSTEDTCTITGVKDKSVTEIVIPDYVTSIGDSAFEDCTYLSSVTIRDGVLSIGNYAFKSCFSLNSITIPDSVTKIGAGAFKMASLQNVYITDLAAWCSIEFMGTYANPLFIAENLYINGELTTDLVIPDSVTCIPDYAFCLFVSLTSVTIPNSVKEIGDYAFWTCYNITSLTIPDSVIEIGASAFEGCESITRIVIGKGILRIAEDAFRDCESLTSIIYDGTKADWEKLDCSPTDVTVYCTDGTLSY